MSKPQSKEAIFQMKKYPSKLEPTPIQQAVFELKFTSTIPDEVVYGMLYGSFNEKYPIQVSLPVSAIPMEIKRSNPDLLNQPHYRMSGDSSLVLLIGPRSIALQYEKYQENGEIAKYPGWTEYIKQEVVDMLNILRQCIPTAEPSRLGIRYTDFFESEDIFSALKMKIKLPDEISETQQMLWKSQFLKNSFNNDITVSNNSQIDIPSVSRTYNGSIIDIDTSKVEFENPFFDNIETYIEQAHLINKELFFDIIQEEYIVSNFNPTY